MSMQTADLSPAQYLKDERKREEKHEYEKGKLILLKGASKSHNLISGNLLVLLWNTLKIKRDFEVYASSLRVFTSEGKNSFYYPDLVITQGREHYLDDEFDTLLNPLILIEVLSDYTEARDRGIKFEAYRSIDSFQEYLLVSQKSYMVEGFIKNEAGKWEIQDSIHGLDQSYQFKCIDAELSLKDIYQNVTL